jgi:hypothetical protein
MCRRPGTAGREAEDRQRVVCGGGRAFRLIRVAFDDWFTYQESLLKRQTADEAAAKLERSSAELASTHARLGELEGRLRELVRASTRHGR